MIEASVYMGISVVAILFAVIMGVAFLKAKKDMVKLHEIDMQCCGILSDIVKEYIFEYDYAMDCIRFSQSCTIKFGFPKAVKLSDDVTKNPVVSVMQRYFAEQKREEDNTELPPFLLTDREGRTQWYTVSLHKVKDSEGRVVRLIAIMLNAQTEIEEQQRKAEMAEKDSLTGIYNRDGLRARLATIYENLEGQMPIAVTMVNFVDFKSVNARLGRAGGDVALKMLAGTINELFGENAVKCRYSGNDFLIFTYGIPEGYLRQILEELISTMDYNLSFQNVTWKLSVSAGSYYSYVNTPYEELCAGAENVLRDVMQSGKSGYRVEGKGR